MRLAVLMDVLKLFLDDGGVLFVTSVLQKNKNKQTKQNMASNIKQSNNTFTVSAGCTDP